MKPRIGTARSLAAPDDGTTTEGARRRTVAYYGRTVARNIVIQVSKSILLHCNKLNYGLIFSPFQGLRDGRTAARRPRPGAQCSARVTPSRSWRCSDSGRWRYARFEQGSTAARSSRPRRRVNRSSCVRFRANRTLNRHRRMTEADPTRTSACEICRHARRSFHFSVVVGCAPLAVRRSCTNRRRSNGRT
jgi:hypothetical protein